MYQALLLVDNQAPQQQLNYHHARESDLRAMLGKIGEITLEAHVYQAAQLHASIQRFQPELIFMPETCEGKPSLPLVRELSIRYPTTAILILSSNQSPTAHIQALEAGAKALISLPLEYKDFHTKTAQALTWVTHIRATLHTTSQQQKHSRGTILTITGAKGGVGTTTIALHLATSVLNDYPHMNVCVVDLDLEKGDVSAALDISYTASIADLASVYKDLSPTTVKDAIIHHESGIHLLLAPTDVRQTENISPEAIRTILSLLREEFDLIIIDAGGYVSPAQATALEIAHIIATVATADVLSIRAMKKRISAWENLGVCQERDVNVLVNKTDRASLFPVESIDKLTSATVINEKIPLTSRTLEPALVSRDPKAVTANSWWKLMATIRDTLLDGHLHQRPQVGHTQSVQAAHINTQQARHAKSQRPQARRKKSESGAISLEFAGIFVVFLALLAILWQGMVAGVSYFWLSQAATESTREYSISASLADAQAAARSTMPDTFARSLAVTKIHETEQLATLQISLTLPQGFSLIPSLSTEREIPKE